LKEIKDLNVGRKTEMIISAPSPSHLPSQMVELGFGGRGHEGVGHCCHCAIVPLLNFVPLMLLGVVQKGVATVAASVRRR